MADNKNINFYDIQKAGQNTALDWINVPFTDLGFKGIANAAESSYAAGKNPYTDPNYWMKAAPNMLAAGAMLVPSGVATAGVKGVTKAAGLLGRTTKPLASTLKSGRIAPLNSFRSVLSGYNPVSAVQKADGAFNKVKAGAGSALKILGTLAAPLAPLSIIGQAQANADMRTAPPATAASALKTPANQGEALQNATQLLKEGKITMADWNAVRLNFEDQFAKQYREANPNADYSGAAYTPEQNAAYGAATSAATSGYNRGKGQVLENLRDTIMGLNQQVTGSQQDLASTLASTGYALGSSPGQLDVGQAAIQQQGVLGEQQARGAAKAKLTELLAQLEQQRANAAIARYNAGQQGNFNNIFGGNA